MIRFFSWFNDFFRRRDPHDRNLDFISSKFQIAIDRPDLYQMALTHRSSEEEMDYERLELLGDAVLDLIVIDYLYKSFPQFNEGRLTKMKSRLVSREGLLEISSQEGLMEGLHIKKQRDLGNHRIMGNVLEAIFGAMYLEQGFKVTKDRALKMFERHSDMTLLVDDHSDPKSDLLEWAQKNKKNIKYTIEVMTDDIEKPFMAQAILEGRVLADGRGASKKKAEKDASANALKLLQ